MLNNSLTKYYLWWGVNMAGTYAIPGYFENCVIKGDRVVENRFLGKVLFEYKNHTLKEPGFLGKTVLVFKRDGIFEPGFAGKRLFNVSKYGEVKETGLFGRTVGAIPTQWVYDAPLPPKEESPSNSSEETHVDTRAQDERELREYKEELDESLGYVADFTNTREGAKKITVPAKYTKFTAIAPFLVRNGLETVVIHKNVCSILTHNIGCSKAYIVDEDNTYFLSDGGVLYSKNKTELLRVPSDIDFGSFEIPNTVVEISKNAFWGCNIESVVIPTSVVRIGDGAFGLCKKLKNVFIPASVKEIGENAFQFDKKAVINAEVDEKPLSWKCDFSENKCVNWKTKAP